MKFWFTAREISAATRLGLKHILYRACAEGWRSITCHDREAWDGPEDRLAFHLKDLPPHWWPALLTHEARVQYLTDPAPMLAQWLRRRRGWFYPTRAV